MTYNDPGWIKDITILENKFQSEFYGCGPVPAKGGGWVNQPFYYLFSADPDKAKNHKHFTAFGVVNGKPVIIGLEDKFDTIIEAMYIPEYDELVYSTFRHDWCPNSTDEFTVDGGRDYTHFSGDPKRYEIVQYNLLTKEIL